MSIEPSCHVDDEGLSFPSDPSFSSRKWAPRIAVIDYGMGNLHSVAKGLEMAGAKAFIVDDPQALGNPVALVLPGVGNFGKCMRNLKDAGFDAVVVDWIEKGRPFLGICLGLQLLYAASEEAKEPGLGVVDAPVVRLPHTVNVPHMGWNTVKLSTSKRPDTAVGDLAKASTTGSVKDASTREGAGGGRKLEECKAGTARTFWGFGLEQADSQYFYFVHSYAATVPPPGCDVVLETSYGIDFVAGFQRGNLWATQFHPEKSGSSGLALLKNFVNACASARPVETIGDP